jgi:hypothetical protein
MKKEDMKWCLRKLKEKEANERGIAHRESRKVYENQ